MAALDTMRTLFRDFTSVFSTAVAANATVDLYLQRGCDELNRRTAYHVSDSTSGVTFVSGTQEYTLPSDCVQVLWIELSGKLLQPSDMDKWRVKAGTNNWRQVAGFPREYAVYGRSVVFYPTPDGASTGLQPVIRYVSTPPDITANGPDGLGSQDYVVPVYFAAALWNARYPYAGNTEAAAFLNQQFETSAQLIKRQLDTRETLA